MQDLTPSQVRRRALELALDGARGYGPDSPVKREIQRRIKRSTPIDWKEAPFIDQETGAEKTLLNLVPLLSSNASSKEALVEAADQDKMGLATGAQMKLLENFADHLVRETTPGAKITGTAVDMIPYAGEYYMTGGFAGPGGKVFGNTAKQIAKSAGLMGTAKKILFTGFRSRAAQQKKWGLKRVFQEGAEAVKRAPGQTVRQTLLGEATGLAGSLFDVEAGGSRIRAGAYMNYLHNRYDWYPANDGGTVIRLADDSYGMWTNAIPASVVDQLTEVFSENVGVAIAHMVPAMKLALLGKYSSKASGFANEGISSKTLAFLGMAGDTNATGIMQKFGVSGITPELGEEFVGAGMRDLVNEAFPELADEGNIEYLLDNIGPIALGMGLGIFGMSMAARASDRGRYYASGGINTVDAAIAHGKAGKGAQKLWDNVVAAGIPEGRAGVLANRQMMSDLASAGLSAEGSAALIGSGIIRAKFNDAEGIQALAQASARQKVQNGEIEEVDYEGQVNAEKAALWGQFQAMPLVTADGKTEALNYLIKHGVIEENEIDKVLDRVEVRLEDLRQAHINGTLKQFFDAFEQRVAESTMAEQLEESAESLELQPVLAVGAFTNAKNQVELLRKAVFERGGVKKDEAGEIIVSKEVENILKAQDAREVASGLSIAGEGAFGKAFMERAGEIEEEVAGDTEEALGRINKLVKGVKLSISRTGSRAPAVAIARAAGFKLIPVEGDANVLGVWDAESSTIFYNPLAIEAYAKEHGLDVDRLYMKVIFKEIIRAHVTSLGTTANKKQWLTASNAWLDNVGARLSKDIDREEGYYEGESALDALEDSVASRWADFASIKFDGESADDGDVSMLRSFGDAVLRLALPQLTYSRKHDAALRRGLEEAGFDTSGMSRGQVVLAYQTKTQLVDIVQLQMSASEAVAKADGEIEAEAPEVAAEAAPAAEPAVEEPTPTVEPATAEAAPTQGIMRNQEEGEPSGRDLRAHRPEEDKVQIFAPFWDAAQYSKWLSSVLKRYAARSRRVWFPGKLYPGFISHLPPAIKDDTLEETLRKTVVAVLTDARSEGLGASKVSLSGLTLDELELELDAVETQWKERAIESFKGTLISFAAKQNAEEGITEEEVNERVTAKAVEMLDAVLLQRSITLAGFTPDGKWKEKVPGQLDVSGLGEPIRPKGGWQRLGVWEGPLLIEAAFRSTNENLQKKAQELGRGNLWGIPAPAYTQEGERPTDAPFHRDFGILREILAFGPEDSISPSFRLEGLGSQEGDQVADSELEALIEGEEEVRPALRAPIRVWIPKGNAKQGDRVTVRDKDKYGEPFTGTVTLVRRGNVTVKPDTGEIVGQQVKGTPTANIIVSRQNLYDTELSMKLLGTAEYRDRYGDAIDVEGMGDDTSLVWVSLGKNEEGGHRFTQRVEGAVRRLSDTAPRPAITSDNVRDAAYRLAQQYQDSGIDLEAQLVKGSAWKPPVPLTKKSKQGTPHAEDMVSEGMPAILGAFFGVEKLDARKLFVVGGKGIEINEKFIRDIEEKSAKEREQNELDILDQLPTFRFMLEGTARPLWLINNGQLDAIGLRTKITEGQFGDSIEGKQKRQALKTLLGVLEKTPRVESDAPLPGRTPRPLEDKETGEPIDRQRAVTDPQSRQNTSLFGQRFARKGTLREALQDKGSRRGAEERGGILDQRELQRQQGLFESIENALRSGEQIKGAYKDYNKWKEENLDGPWRGTRHWLSSLTELKDISRDWSEEAQNFISELAVVDPRAPQTSDPSGSSVDELAREPVTMSLLADILSSTPMGGIYANAAIPDGLELAKHMLTPGWSNGWISEGEVDDEYAKLLNEIGPDLLRDLTEGNGQAVIDRINDGHLPGIQYAIHTLVKDSAASERVGRHKEAKATASLAVEIAENAGLSSVAADLKKANEGIKRKTYGEAEYAKTGIRTYVGAKHDTLQSLADARIDAIWPYSSKAYLDDAAKFSIPTAQGAARLVGAVKRAGEEYGRKAVQDIEEGRPVKVQRRDIKSGRKGFVAILAKQGSDALHPIANILDKARLMARLKRQRANLESRKINLKRAESGDLFEQRRDRAIVLDSERPDPLQMTAEALQEELEFWKGKGYVVVETPQYKTAMRLALKKAGDVGQWDDKAAVKARYEQAFGEVPSVMPILGIDEIPAEYVARETARREANVRKSFLALDLTAVRLHALGGRAEGAGPSLVKEGPNYVLDRDATDGPEWFIESMPWQKGKLAPGERTVRGPISPKVKVSGPTRMERRAGVDPVRKDEPISLERREALDDLGALRIKEEAHARKTGVIPGTQYGHVRRRARQKKSLFGRLDRQRKDEARAARPAAFEQDEADYLESEWIAHNKRLMQEARGAAVRPTLLGETAKGGRRIVEGDKDPAVSRLDLAVGVGRKKLLNRYNREIQFLDGLIGVLAKGRGDIARRTLIRFHQKHGRRVQLAIPNGGVLNPPSFPPNSETLRNLFSDATVKAGSDALIIDGVVHILNPTVVTRTELEPSPRGVYLIPRDYFEERPMGLFEILEFKTERTTLYHLRNIEARAAAAKEALEAKRSFDEAAEGGDIGARDKGIIGEVLSEISKRPTDREVERAAINAANAESALRDLENVQTEQGVARVIRKNQHIEWAEVNRRALKAASGPAGLDITDREIDALNDRELKEWMQRLEMKSKAAEEVPETFPGTKDVFGKDIPWDPFGVIAEKARKKPPIGSSLTEKGRERIAARKRQEAIDKTGSSKPEALRYALTTLITDDTHMPWAIKFDRKHKTGPLHFELTAVRGGAASLTGRMWVGADGTHHYDFYTKEYKVGRGLSSQEREAFETVKERILAEYRRQRWAYTHHPGVLGKIRATVSLYNSNPRSDEIYNMSAEEIVEKGIDLPKFMAVANSGKIDTVNRELNAVGLNVPHIWDIESLPAIGNNETLPTIFLMAFDQWRRDTNLAQFDASREAALHTAAIENFVEGIRGLRGGDARREVVKLREAIGAYIDISGWTSPQGLKRQERMLNIPKGLDAEGLWDYFAAKAGTQFTPGSREVFDLSQEIGRGGELQPILDVANEMIAEQDTTTSVALGARLIGGGLTDYMSLSWTRPNDEDINMNSSGSFRTGVGYRAKSKMLASVIEGWSRGWSLKYPDGVESLKKTRLSVYEARHNKAMLQVLKLTGIVKKVTGKRGKLVPLEALAFKGYQTEPWVATYLNNATSTYNIKDIKNKPYRVWMHLTTAMKRMLLAFGPFHHHAFRKSFMYTVGNKAAGQAFVNFPQMAAASALSYGNSAGRVTRKRLNDVARGAEAFRKGQDLWRANDPLLRELIAEGMTVQLDSEVRDSLIGGGYNPDEVRDMDQWVKALGEELTKMGMAKGLVERFTSVINGTREFQRNTAIWLFNEFGSALKAQGGILKYRELLEKHAEKLKTDHDGSFRKDIAKQVAMLLNADFGGLDYKGRGGKLGKGGPRHGKTMMLARALLLASDWTESNLLTVRNMMLKDGRLATSSDIDAMGKNIYRIMWLRVMSRAMLLQIVANALLAGMDDERTFADLYAEAGFPGMGDEDAPHWAQLRWLMINLSGLSPNDSRKFLSTLGHFGDPWNWTVEVLGDHEGSSLLTPLVKKGSPMAQVVLNAFTGRDWSHRRFTSWDELLGVDADAGVYSRKTTLSDGTVKHPGDSKAGRYKGETSRFSMDNGPLKWPEIPSFTVEQLRRGVPIPIRNLFDTALGSKDAFDAFFMTAGYTLKRTY